MSTISGQLGINMIFEITYRRSACVWHLSSPRGEPGAKFFLSESAVGKNDIQIRLLLNNINIYYLPSAIDFYQAFQCNFKSFNA